MDTVVFLGPTLSLEKARSIFPEACFHRPARCGDITRVLRLKPKNILLIDGYFETAPSVWHKEILFAMETGVVVYGASSMGALRAAECAPFGVRGIGEIYRQYLQGNLNEDDAVAVLHAAYQNDYSQTSEALVDIKATLERASTEGAVSLCEKEEILSELSSCFYPERTIERLKAMPSLNRWLQANNLIRQKAEDAIEALMHLKNTSVTEKIPRCQVVKTTLLCSLIRTVNISSFRDAYDWLPKEEKDLVIDSQNTLYFTILTELAFALSVAADLSRSPLENVLKEVPVWISARIGDSLNSKEQIAMYTCFLKALLLKDKSRTAIEKDMICALSNLASLIYGIDCHLQLFPYIFEWRGNPHVQHMVESYHSLDSFIQAARETTEFKEKQYILISTFMRYYYFFKGALYNTLAPGREVQSFNWLISAKPLIHGSL